jgi:hypothetical protein
MHQYFKDLSCLVFKEAVVRQDNRCPASALEDVHYMLYKIKLFVAGGYGKIATFWRLIGPFRAERWIGKNAIVLLASIGLID